jgi:hypothetical protein
MAQYKFTNTPAPLAPSATDSPARDTASSEGRSDHSVLNLVMPYDPTSSVLNLVKPYDPTQGEDMYAAILIKQSTYLLVGSRR